MKMTKKMTATTWDSVADADREALAAYEAKRASRKKALEARGVEEDDEEEEECAECGQVKP